MTYSTLKTLVADYLDRSDLTSFIPNFITSAQRKIERGDEIGIETPIRVNEDWHCMKAYATGSFTSSSPYLSLPSRYKKVQAFYVISNGDHILLTKKSLKYVLIQYPDLTADKNIPVLYATDKANERFVVRPTPDSAYVYHLYYYKYLSELSADADTNWWTTDAWEILLYGALLQSEPFLKNDSRIALWTTLLKKALIGLKQSEKQEETSGSYLTPTSLYVV